jgi:hypothetical protein
MSLRGAECQLKKVRVAWHGQKNPTFEHLGRD